MSDKATFGLPRNIAAALSYVGVAFTGVLFYLFERDDKFVRFHALQSIVFFGGMAVLNYVLKFVFSILRFFPIIGGLFAFLGGIVFFVTGIVAFIGWIFLILNALQGRSYQLPIVGRIVQAQLDK